MPLKELYPRLWAFIRKRVRVRHDAEDVLQNVFFQFAKIDDLLHPIEQVSAWMFRVARNQIVDLERKRTETPLSQLGGDDPDYSADLLDTLLSPDTPEAAITRALFWDLLSQALSELPEEQRYIFEMTEFNGESYKELAEATGVSVNTLLSRKRYAVMHLRKRLQEIHDTIIEQK